jgi:hypothetical protein
MEQEGKRKARQTSNSNRANSKECSRKESRLKRGLPFEFGAWDFEPSLGLNFGV